MGFYINPRDETKEEFLRREGILLNGAPKVHKEGDYIAVCLVDNGAFTAAAVAYSQGELEAFQERDGRQKRWFAVPKGKLTPYMEGHEL